MSNGVKFQVERLEEANEENIDSINKMINEHLSFGLMNHLIVEDLILNHRVYIAKTPNNLIIGVLCLRFMDGYNEICHVVTLAEYRRKGICSQLLKIALKEYDSNLDLRARGWVKPNGWDAQSIFLNNGFEIISVDKNYWKKDCTSSSFCPYHTCKCNCSALLVQYKK